MNDRSSKKKKKLHSVEQGRRGTSYRAVLGRERSPSILPPTHSNTRRKQSVHIYIEREIRGVEFPARQAPPQHLECLSARCFSPSLPSSFWSFSTRPSSDCPLQISRSRETRDFHRLLPLLCLVLFRSFPEPPLVLFVSACSTKKKNPRISLAHLHAHLPLPPSPPWLQV